MKLRTITLAAAGLLATAAVQAELQTWRFTDSHGVVGPAGTFLDVVFDTDARIEVVTDTTLQLGQTTFEAWVNPIVSCFFNGVTYTPTGGNWIPTGTSPSVLWKFGANASGAPSEVSFDAFDRGGSFDGQGKSLSQALELLAERLPLNEDPALPPVFHKQPILSVTRTLAGLQLVDGLVASRMERISSVPEPSAWALTLLGSLGAAALARRRQKATAQVS